MDNWTSILKNHPSDEGTYYVYISNIMDSSNEIAKVKYQNEKWLIFQLKEY